MRWLRICLLMVFGAVAACSGSGESATRAEIRVGVLPDQSEDRLRSQYEPLLAHLEAVAGVETELILPSSYDDLLSRFADGEIDLAWFGGLSYLHADLQGGARPLVVRDVDLEFTTDFIATASAPGQELADFLGAPFAFGPELSTSGHLMPRSHLTEAGLTPEVFFGAITHSGGHDETVSWVQDGTVTVGAVNSVLFESMVEEGLVSTDDVRLIERTRPYRNYVWTTRSDLAESTRTRLLDGFLSFDLTDRDHREILDRLGAGGFLPASASDFSELRNAAELAGLLDGGDT